MPDMLEVSKALRSAGLSVIRVSTNGTKSPDVGPATGYKWAPYWDQLATVEQLAEWFGDGHPGIGIITGSISGNLEMLEFEGRALNENVHAAFFAAVQEAGGTDLLNRVVGGYLESSPSGGLHLFYRIDGRVDGNTKLAEREATDDELTEEERDLLSTKGKRARRTLVETRGEHGFVVVAPSHGPVHLSGQPWQVLAGSVATIARVTEDERDLLHACARSLDQIPLPEPIPDEHPRDPAMQPGDKTPGEDFNDRATWREILEPHGWTLKRDTGIRAFWCRPGKREGNSAVTGGEQGDYFYAWTTSTELPAETTMSKWRVYAYLEHGADFKAAASALRRKGFGSPRREPERPVDEWDFLPENNGNGSPERTLAVVSASPVTLTYVRSDDGNAQSLIEQYGHVIRFCPERGKWLAWQGTLWEWAEGKNGGLVREYAKRIGRALPDNDAEAKKHKRYTLSAMGTTAMLVQAATDYRVAVRLSDLDARPLELNTPGGTVDLTTGVLGPHDPQGLHTRTTSCTPDYGASGGRWDTFLRETFAGHEELIPYIQRLAGYSASGIVGEHVLPFAYGPTGRNGKGVFLETIRAILGDYGTVAPNSFLMSQQFSKHETEIADLVGTRMVLCSEVNVSDKFDEAKVKLLTGGDTLKARFMRENLFSFKPTHKLWLMGNDQPTVTAGGQAFWERLRIIPFDNTVPKERRILGLQDIFARDYGPAILAWVIIGAVNYFNGGLSEPDSVRAATTGYAYAQDSVSQWMDECVQLSSSQDVKLNTAIARTNYEQWCKLEGESPVTPKRFGMIMKTYPGVGYIRSNGARFYVGLSLTGEAGTDRSRRYGEQAELGE